MKLLTQKFSKKLQNFQQNAWNLAEEFDEIFLEIFLKIFWKSDNFFGFWFFFSEMSKFRQILAKLSKFFVENFCKLWIWENQKLLKSKNSKLWKICKNFFLKREKFDKFNWTSEKLNAKKMRSKFANLCKILQKLHENC